LERAFRRFVKPEIFNTDQGRQFTGAAFTGLLKEKKGQISMDAKGRAMDNIFVERLWRSLKYEEVYLKEYASAEDLRRSLKTYFEFYNLERPEPGSPKTKGFWGGNQSHQGRTSAEVHFGPNPIQGLAA